MRAHCFTTIEVRIFFDLVRWRDVLKLYAGNHRQYGLVGRADIDKSTGTEAGFSHALDTGAPQIKGRG